MTSARWSTRATHRRQLLDAFSGLEKDVASARSALGRATALPIPSSTSTAPAWNAPRAKPDYLRHASDELKQLSPKEGEETSLAHRRTTMMQGEKIASDLREAQEVVGGHNSPARGAVGRRAPAGASRCQCACDWSSRP
jgi:DNA repair protein RecN (Recombination protein N)